MTRESDERGENPASPNSAIPFTARLNAYYRAIESKSKDPLILDPLAEQLAGDMTEYFERHPRFAEMGGSQIARSYYIENELLESWCESHVTSQVVLLGAGLDTRVYRFKPLARHSHTIFELDLPSIIEYKERRLQNERPLCKLVRVSADLSQQHWISSIREMGFSEKVPTFWILEGFVYYLEKKQVHELLKTISNVSTENSQLFVDVCVPALADLRWGPFTDYFRWGISKDDVHSFFASSGWRVTSSFLDTYAHGKDVGQKGLILVHGYREMSGIADDDSLKDSSTETMEIDIPKFSCDLTRKIIPKIEELVEICNKDREKLLSSYVEFIRTFADDLQTIAKNQENPILLGTISPRLLGDPLSIIDDSTKRTDEETQSFITSNLQAIVKLVYCGVKGIQAYEYKDTIMGKESRKATEGTGIESVAFLLTILGQEIRDSN